MQTTLLDALGNLDILVSAEPSVYTLELMANEPGLELKKSLVGSGLTQRDVARQLQINEGLLSRYLDGSRPLPEGFVDRFREAFDKARMVKAQRLLNAQPMEVAIR